MYKTIIKIFNIVLNIGIHSDITIEEKRKLRVINQMIIVNIIIAIIYLTFFSILKLHELYFIQFILLTTLLTGYLIKGAPKHNIGSFILLYVLPLELLYYPLFVGNIGTEFIFFVLIIIGYYVLDKKLNLILLTAFITIIIVISYYFIFNNQYPEEYKILEKLCYYPNILISVLLISLTTYLFKNDSIRYQNTIEGQQKELKVKVQELKKREKTLSELLSELNYRVDNNLQVISSLFSIHINNSKNEEVRTALKAARYRIDAISILYQHLNKKANNTKPNLKKYIEELSQYELKMSGVEDLIELKLEVDTIHLKIEIISHIGLLINELMTNTFKYGMRKDNLKTKVCIMIHNNNNTIDLGVNDNGNGFTKEALMKRKDSFGMKLIYAISEQYNGEVNIYNNDGAHTDIKLFIQ